MDRYLHADVLETNPSLPLTAQEFDALRDAGATLRAALAMEEIFDLLLTNYRELELSALKFAVADLTSPASEYGSFFSVRSELNRRTLNVLSAARLYLDQFPRWVKEMGTDRKAIRELSNTLYDSRFEYRFMEALRNHVQHAGFAVHGVTMGSKWVPEGKREHLEAQFEPYAMKSALAQDKQFKTKVLNECPEKISIIPATRKYIEALSAIHREIRAKTGEAISAARGLFQQKIEEHEAQAGQRLSGLSATAKNNGVVEERIPVFLNWDEVRISMVKKNPALHNLSKRYITSLYHEEKRGPLSEV